MLTHLTSWLVKAAHWGPLVPLVPLIPIAMLALIQTLLLPTRLWVKSVWVLLLVMVCSFAGHILVRRDRASETEIGTQADSEIAKLNTLWTQLDDVAQGLPPAGEAPAPAFDSVDHALTSLSAKITSNEAQVAALKAQIATLNAQIAALKVQQPEPAHGRSIDADTAAKLTEYLRPYGGNRVVVSCVPNDLEAYIYANQLVTILTMAGGEARGPELTVAADATAMGISLYVRDPRTVDPAKILIDAFNRFNIPYQPGLAGSDAIPDTATVELFVAKKP